WLIQLPAGDGTFPEARLADTSCQQAAAPYRASGRAAGTTSRTPGTHVGRLCAAGALPQYQRSGQPGPGQTGYQCAAYRGSGLLWRRGLSPGRPGNWPESRPSQYRRLVATSERWRGSDCPDGEWLWCLCEGIRLYASQ